MKKDISTEERIEMLEEAKAKIAEAVETIESATRDLPEWNTVKTYVIAPLEMTASDDNQWVGKHQETVQGIIDHLTEQAEEEETDRLVDLERAQDQAEETAWQNAGSYKTAKTPTDNGQTLIDEAQRRDSERAMDVMVYGDLSAPVQPEQPSKQAHEFNTRIHCRMLVNKNKIAEAIAYYKVELQKTDEEAKAYVSGLVDSIKGIKFPETPAQPNREVLIQVRKLALEGQMVQAVKFHREKLGSSFQEAYDFAFSIRKINTKIGMVDPEVLVEANEQMISDYEAKIAQDEKNLAERLDREEEEQTCPRCERKTTLNSKFGLCQPCLDQEAEDRGDESTPDETPFDEDELAEEARVIVNALEPGLRKVADKMTALTDDEAFTLQVFRDDKAVNTDLEIVGKLVKRGMLVVNPAIPNGQNFKLSNLGRSCLETWEKNNAIRAMKRGFYAPMGGAIHKMANSGGALCGMRSGKMIPCTGEVTCKKCLKLPEQY